MSQIVIQVENLSKLYRLGEVTTGTMSHDLNRWWHRIRGKDDPYAKIGQTNDRTRKAGSEYVWALKDINFKVAQGEVLGIIGRNGAGKSTLLKLLSRVTSPTGGHIKIRGRFASLLEVGTGFHPELTGRENIYLNGAILGMSRREITSKLDEIVDFSGCEAYLETPVKRYSSGMKVRLAFAVAAFLEAEILMIDEVLAVGDGEFQRKCLGKMNDVANQGRTLLFVSHNMGLISSLCSRVMLLEHGGIAMNASASDAILGYYTNGRSTPFDVDFCENQRHVEGHGIQLLKGSVATMDGRPVPDIDMRESFTVRMKYRLHSDSGGALYPNIHVTDSTGSYVFVTSALSSLVPPLQGDYEAVCIIPGNLLNAGTYFFGLAVTVIDKGVKVAFFEKDALCVNITELIDETLDASRNGYSGTLPGSVRPVLQWQIRS
jgi:lipopolysaccharide transport system ATP-binding protein